MADTKSLHLPSLTIKGFRGIDALSIPRLGRVTLLAGKNSIGKTTVLDAVRIYASRAGYRALHDLLLDREEVLVETDEDRDATLVPDWRALLCNRNVSSDACISIGQEDTREQLTIQLTTPDGAQVDVFGPRIEGTQVQELKVTYASSRDDNFPWIISFDLQTPYSHITSNTATTYVRRGQTWRFKQGEPPPAIQCEYLGPGLVSNKDLARLWDGVALTNDEERTVSALQLVFGDFVERVAAVGDNMTYPGRLGRRVVVRLRGESRPVPLRSLGDGAFRLFCVAMALANSRSGFLLIDEAENGIHYSLQREFWKMVIRTAHENDVQVFATTHSSDCIKGFAQAAIEFEEDEGVLVRLSRQYGDLRAVDYPEDELAIAAEQGIEVR